MLEVSWRSTSESLSLEKSKALYLQCNSDQNYWKTIKYFLEQGNNDLREVQKNITNLRFNWSVILKQGDCRVASEDRK